MAAERYWEIDLARGIAVVTMIVFHSAFDLNFFGVLPLDVSGGLLRMLAYLTASTFIFLVGVSFTISYARAARRLTRRGLALKYVRRGLTIFSYGLVITAVTWIFLPSVYVVFGILHFIGVAILLAPLFARFGTTNLIPGTACILCEPRLCAAPPLVRSRPHRHGLRVALLPGREPGFLAPDGRAGVRPAILDPRPALALHLLPAPAAHPSPDRGLRARRHAGVLVMGRGGLLRPGDLYLQKSGTSAKARTSKTPRSVTRTSGMTVRARNERYMKGFSTAPSRRACSSRAARRRTTSS